MKEASSVHGRNVDARRGFGARVRRRVLEPMRRHPAATVFVASLLAYHANMRPLGEVDCVPAPYTAWMLVKAGTFDLGGNPRIAEVIPESASRRVNGRLFSKYPPGNSLACVPVILPVALVTDEPPSKLAMLHLGKLSSALWVSAAAALFYLTVRSNWPRAAVAAAILFAFGTNLMSVASQASWGHGPAVFFVTLATWMLFAAGPGMTVRRALLIGLALGAGATCRYTVALPAIFAGVAFVWNRWWRPLVPFAAALGACAAAVWLHNRYSFGAAVAGGYADESARWQLQSMPANAAAFLASPSRGLLAFSPGLLLSLVGLVWLPSEFRLNRTRGVLLLTCFLAAVATLLLYAAWEHWWGGWCYGPRLLIHSLPAWCLLFAVAYQRLPRRWLRAAAWVLIGLSVLVHVAGVVARNGYRQWHTKAQAEDLSPWDAKHNLLLYQFRDLVD